MNKNRQTEVIGQKFGKLTITKYDHTERKYDRNHLYFLCKCDCGNNCVTSYINLKSGGTKSCGCLKLKSCHDDIMGKKFGKLTVIENHHTKHKEGRDRVYYFLCRCDCGNNHVTSSPSLRNGRVKSCGCSRLKSCHDDVIGKKFGNLTVIKYHHTKQKKGQARVYYFLCKCDCGNEHICLSRSLKRGLTKSCGCLHVEQGKLNIKLAIAGTKKSQVEGTNLNLIESKKVRSNTGIRGGVFSKVR